MLVITHPLGAQKDDMCEIHRCVILIAPRFKGVTFSIQEKWLIASASKTLLSSSKPGNRIFLSWKNLPQTKCKETAMDEKWAWNGNFRCAQKDPFLVVVRSWCWCSGWLVASGVRVEIWWKKSIAGVVCKWINESSSTGNMQSKNPFVQRQKLLIVYETLFFCSHEAGEFLLVRKLHPSHKA